MIIKQYLLMTKPLPTVKWLAAQHSPGEGQWKDGGTEWTQDGVSSVKLTANGLGNWRLGGRAWKRAVWPSPHTCLSLETSVPPVGSICELVKKLTFPWSHGPSPVHCGLLSLQSGEENVYPLQYSCLENSMDRGGWWTTVHGVTQSRTRLSN